MCYLAGLIKGGETMDITFSWIPSGAYDLRSTVKLKTNIGSREIHIRGKSLQPELFIRHSKLDYGICATNVRYRKTFVLCNRGKVTLSWKISDLSSNLADSFDFSSKSGSILPGATFDVVVTFTPKDYKKYSAHVIVECRGSTSRDVTLIGVGGIFEIDWTPKSLEFGKPPYHLLFIY
jgi:hypothetical protein